jgi:putative tryptophan/tyrosine transport system substrate-binding protein
MNARRKVLFVLGLNFLLVPLLAPAQPASKIRRIGVLSGGIRPVPWESSTLNGFLQGMRDLGYVEGKDFVVEWRFAEGHYERFPSYAQELVSMNVDVIFAVNTRGAIEAQRATKTIPIVFAALSDPVGSGLVASLARPGGNITGVAEATDLVIAKHLELSMLAVPSLTRVTALINPANPLYPPMVKSLEVAAQKAGIKVSLANARSLEELEPAFASMKRDHTDVVIVLDDSLFMSNRSQVAALATNYELPAIAGNTEYASAGLLMSYGGRIRDQFQRGATYVDKIFKGARPAELPVEQPTRFYLTVNLKAANALGLTIPQSLLLRADEVIR